MAVNGASGRMGRTVIETAAERADLSVSFGVDTAADEAATPPVYDAGSVASATATHGADVFVDFSRPEATVDLAETCTQQNVALVTGTTGFSETQLGSLESTSEQVPVLKAANFSRGIQALLRALEPALSALQGYDIELSETHHNGKEDAPSGTATTILEAIQEERDLEPVYGRQGIAPRGDDEIGVQVSRLGDVRGEHEVRLGGNDEVLSIAHRAEDRAVFAAGALDAAVWLAARNPGWYTFGDVIGDQ
ncbi:MAG: 4-hydroxy-tetrahydrodipicolinate reductase [Haloarculaceae archaeon]